ncbi:flagellar type III secretion system pore protein FliP [Erythrobacter sp. JK5]|uniref:flagellar type III secretion system pore protein FliP n=1 Tax=Erythrobacter sp. JK5 TaxID=2829500 RepID=UPI001BABC9BD|nr:flagellar type III secretion system pore protein FliP [Erythrobacter sp. JK5]QUL36907.1 flagellar type III secretion system pore protein FliP [Erythrobacter sp. JK5]
MARALYLAGALMLGALTMFSLPDAAYAAALPVPADSVPGVGGAIERALGGDGAGDSTPLSFSLQLLVVMSLLTILPALVLMMTSFLRILVVLSILRQAIGLQGSPPTQVLVGLALFLSLFVMAPTLSAVNTAAIEPYASGALSADAAIASAGEAFHGFMIRQTREANLLMFADLAGGATFANPDDIPFSILLPAFVTSELETAFQIGFMLFLPFLVIDLVVASVLMSLGMMMLSPTIVSLPFKLLLFVLVDGWALLMGSLAMSFAQ